MHLIHSWNLEIWNMELEHWNMLTCLSTVNCSLGGGLLTDSETCYLDISFQVKPEGTLTITCRTTSDKAEFKGLQGFNLRLQVPFELPMSLPLSLGGQRK